MKLIQELLVLSESSGTFGFKQSKFVDLTPDQTRALENEIGDHFGFDVEVDSVTDLGNDAYKAYVSYDDPKTRKARHHGVKFKGSFKSHSVEDFKITEDLDEAKQSWSDDLDYKLNLWGHNNLEAAINSILKKSGAKVDGMKRNEIYILIGDKDPRAEKVEKLIRSTALNSALSKFNLEYHDNDLNSRLRHGDDYFILYVKRKDGNTAVKSK